MAGAVIENVSSKKLYVGAGFISLTIFGGFLIGGLYIDSKPNHASENIATECKEANLRTYMPWHPKGAQPLPDQQDSQCVDIVPGKKIKFLIRQFFSVDCKLTPF